MKYLQLSLLLLMLWGFSHQTNAQILQSDYDALVTFYNSTNGASWTTNTNWLGPNDASISTWFGLTISGDRVTQINLSNNALSGTLPAAIGDLTALTVLRLGQPTPNNNTIAGTIPLQIGNLTNLTQLRLNNNQFTGNIPAEIGNLTSLTILNLENNQLSGGIPIEIGNLTNLTQLYLFNNPLTGNIPTEIGNLINLTQLFLSNNQLSGSIPIIIGNLTNLTVLSLSSNQLTGNIPVEIGNLNNLTNLTISFNQLTGNIPVEIGNLSSLTSLQLIGNQLNGNIPAEIGNLSSLTSLQLIGNQLNGNIPAEIGNLSSLTFLRLDANQLSGNIPVEIGNLSSLTTLNLSSNQLSGNIPVEIGSLTNLTNLLLRSNQLTGNIPVEIGNLSSLTNLQLWNNQLSGELPAGLANNTGFTVLRLENNFITAIPDFSAATGLNGTNFQIQNNNLTFESIEPNLARNPTYAPQRVIPSPGNITLYEGEPFSVSFEVGGTANSYQWSKNAAIISGAIADTFTIPAVSLSDAGTYTLSATNSLAPLLTLNTEGIVLTVLEPTPLMLDSLALVALYNSTNGPEWTSATNWLTGPLSTWQGITVSNGRVATINLPSNNLSGTLPDEIGNLNALQVLILGEIAGTNNIGGSIPETIGNLSALVNLQLRFNNFTGNIPSSIGNLSNLQVLFLGANNLSGPVPASIGNLTQLVLLELLQNQLTGNIPTEIGNLTNLTSLGLASNQFSGTVPESFGNLINVTSFQLQTNQLSGSLPATLVNLSALSLFNFSNNLFTGGIPEWLGDITSLTILQGDNNPLGGNIPDALGNLINLTALSFSNCQLTGNIPQVISNLNALTFLRFDTNQLTGDIPADIGSLSSLTRLLLNNNQLSGPLPSGLSNNTNFTELRIQNNFLTSIPDFSAATGLNGLANFQIQNNNLTFESIEPNLARNPAYAPQRLIPAPAEFNLNEGDEFTVTLEVGGSDNVYQWKKNNVNLSDEVSNTISIPSVSVADAGTYVLEISSNLVPGLILNSENIILSVASSFDIESDSLALVAFYNSTNGPGWTNSTNWLTGSVSTWQGITVSNGRVTTINLPSNNLSGTLPDEIGNLNALQVLILGEIAGTNNIGGSIPETIGNLSALVNLQLRFNNFTGNIPSSIGNLSNLQVLFLGANNLSGPVPASIGNLTQLVFLELLQNQLTGNIPTEIGNLTNLTSLGLASNQFSGTVPESFGNLINVTSFQLQTNQLSGTLPASLVNLSALSSFNFSNNLFTGGIPEWLGDITSLTILQGDNNPLGGNIPDALGNLINLTALSFSNCQLTGNIPQIISNLNALTFLRFDTNQLTGDIPADIGSLSSLTRLLLNNNQLTGFLPIGLANNTGFIELRIHNNFLTSIPDFSAATGLNGLANFQIQNNNLTFESIEPNLVRNPTYAPQRLIPAPAEFNLNEGDEFTVTLEVGGSDNVYQWKKNNVNLSAEVSNTISIPSVSVADAGSYRLEITSNLVPGLTLSSQNIILSVSDGFDVVSDSLALVAFYNSTNGPGWTNSTNWLTGALSTWHGIAVTGNRVTQISLANNALSGSIPTEIGNLTNLTDLFLFGNQLTGNIPVEIGNLTNLKDLRLFSNQLTGNIPTEIGNLSNLIGLYLYNNQLSGNIPTAIGNLTKLTDLRLFSNQLTGNIPTEIANLTNLSVLLLFSNQLSGNIPIEIDNLTNLTSLRLDGNQLTGNIPAEIANLNSLQALWLNNNQLSGALPAGLANITGFISLRLENNFITSIPDFSAATGLNGTTNFQIQNNNLTFESIEPNIVRTPNFSPQRLIPAPAEFNLNEGDEFTVTLEVGGSDNVYQWKKNNVNLSGEVSNTISIPSVSVGDQGTYRLEITSNLVSGLTLSSQNIILSVADGFDMVSDSLALVAFYNSTNGPEWTSATNWLSGPLSTWQGITLSNGRVTVINLPNNNLTGTLPAEIADLSRLQLLRIGTDFNPTNKITGNIPAEIGSLINLTELNLSGNTLSGSIPTTIGNLENLLILRLSINQLSGSIPPEIFNLSNLTILNLSQNQLSGNISPLIGNLNNLTSLNLSANQLSGTIPDEIWSLTSLNFLSLFNNQLSGVIPPAIGNLTNLTTLSLVGNQLSGSLPPEIGNLSNLTFLQLSNLQLSGSLPAEIGNLTALRDFFISNNQLSGELPAAIGNLSQLRRVWLNNNQFTGVLPSTFANLSELTEFRINNNFIEALPDLSALVNLNGTTNFQIQNNNLTFESIEPNIVRNPNFSPQRLIPAPESIVLTEEDEFTLSIPVGGSANTYQWKKNNINIEGQTTETINIPGVALSDAGTYALEITNSIVSGLVLRTSNIVLSVNERYNLTTDSIALVAFYNSTQGQNWKNKTNWLSTPLAAGNWFGLTISNNRVSEISLPDNNLDGEVPEIFTELKNLSVLDVSSNTIKAIPDLSVMPLLNTINLSSNQLDFTSLIANAGISGINYQNQAEIGTERRVLVDVGEDYRMGFEVLGEGNIFSWTYNGNLIPGAVDSIYTIRELGRSNMGDYRLLVNNPQVPDLTLQSANQNVLAVANISGILYYNKGSDDDDEDDDEPATQGKVSLFRITTSGAYDTTRVQQVNIDGTFLLDRIVLDDYLLLGQVDTIVYKDALPTWFTQTIFWEEADTILFNNNINGLEIVSEKRPTEVLKGPGLFIGYFEEDLPDNGKFEKRERVKDAAVIVSRIERIARNEETIVLTLVAYVYTNENGEFVVEGLDQGTYRINIQYPGYPMDEKSFVEFNIGQGVRATIINVEALVINNKITVRQFIITGVEGNENYEVKVYPNPATEIINIQFVKTSENRNIAIIDNSGRIKENITAKNLTSQINVSDFTPGLYFIKITESGLSVKTIKLLVK
jgi:Leucine-rich repeat (LRR) protein